MRRVLVASLFAAVLSAAVLAAPGCSSGLDATRGGVVRLGAFLGLSGDIAAYGQSQKRGIDLAVAAVNAGNGRALQVVTEDTGPSTDGAVAAMKKLIDGGHVAGIIGPTLSAQAFAADPIAQQKRVPVVGISNTVPGITEMGDFIFRCSLPESSVVAGTVKVAADVLKVNKVGVLWGKGDTYTEGGYQAFVAAFKTQGMQSVGDETFVRGDTDFKLQLSKIISQKPDAIAVSAYLNEASLITMQLRGLGFTGTILGSNGFNSTDIIRQAGAAAEGIVVGTAWNEGSAVPANTRFIAAFQKAYGTAPDQFAAQSYTGVLIYANAVGTAGSADPAAIRDALLKTRDLETPLGLFSFIGREPVHPAAVQVVRGGKFVVLERA